MMKKKINSIAKDVEEKWGLWMKKSCLGEYIDYKREKEIEESYENLEMEIRKNYFKPSESFIKLLNPFNYISYKDYSSAYKQDSDSCFFAQYEGAMENINKIKTDNEKDCLKNKVTETYNKLQDNLQTSLEAMYATVSNLNNTITEESENLTTYKDCVNDIKEKLDIIGKISGRLRGNIEIIESSKGNNKHSLGIKKYISIEKLTNNLDITKYFDSMDIYGYLKLFLE